VIDLPGQTLVPGLIDAHTHLLLHPYNEATWEDQVLKEPLALRVCRAANHARAILDSGFTMVRDLGTEGAGYADVGVKMAIDQGVIRGPTLLASTRAIVATGSYAPRGFAPELRIPQGAEEADGVDLVRVVRDQMSRGADWIKVYADQWHPRSGGKSTFSVEELERIVQTAGSGGCPVAAHATTREGMRRAAEAGVRTIEHGDQGDAEVFQLMKRKGVALCPTLAASEAVLLYRGYRPSRDEEPADLAHKRASFQAAMEAGVEIVNGSDMGVFAHGSGARELELLVAWGMSPAAALRSATSVAAEVLGLSAHVGSIRPGLDADLVAVEGNPLEEISAIRKVRLVLKRGEIVGPSIRDQRP
jgi:imidazolonepropionase-like amidohydrolase